MLRNKIPKNIKDIDEKVYDEIANDIFNNY